MQSHSKSGSAHQTHLSKYLWLYRDYITTYKNNKLRHQHPSHVRLIRKIIFPSCDLFLLHVIAPFTEPKNNFCLTLFHTFCFRLNFIYAPFDLRQVFMIYSWGDCVQRRDVKGWAEWVPVRRSVVPAKVNKEELYHTIGCLWSVTHGIWTAARSLPTSLFACLTDSGQALKNLSCRFSK